MAFFRALQDIGCSFTILMYAALLAFVIDEQDNRGLLFFPSLQDKGCKGILADGLSSPRVIWNPVIRLKPIFLCYSNKSHQSLLVIGPKMAIDKPLPARVKVHGQIQQAPLFD